jgi:hypothetical protein
MKIKNKILYSSLFIIILIIYGLILGLTNFKQLTINKLQSKFPESKFSNIVITRFPIPKISIENFLIDGKFASDRIDIKISPLSILIFNPSIKEITCTNSNYVTTEHNPLINHYNIISNLLSVNIADEIIFQTLALSNIATKKTRHFKKLIISKDSIFLQTEKNNILTISRILSDSDTTLSIISKSSLYDFNIKELYANNLMISSSGNINLNLDVRNKETTNIVFAINTKEDSKNIEFKSNIKVFYSFLILLKLYTKIININFYY